MTQFDLISRGVLQGTVELMLMDRATQQESRELLEEVLSMIKRMPAADVIPAVHAHWQSDTWCSRCGAVKLPAYNSKMQANLYCHQCAAKMDAREG